MNRATANARFKAEFGPQLPIFRAQLGIYTGRVFDHQFGWRRVTKPVMGWRAIVGNKLVSAATVDSAYSQARDIMLSSYNDRENAGENEEEK